MKKSLLAILILFLAVINALGEVKPDGLTRTAWAPKLRGGPIKFLCLAPYPALQDAHELSRRMEVDVKGVGVACTWRLRAKSLGIHSFYWPEFEKNELEIMEEIRSALKTDWEAIVMSDYPTWERYPRDIRDTIIDQVAQGRVLLIPFEKSFIEDLKKNPIELKETDIGNGKFLFKNNKSLTGKIHRYGKGFIVNYGHGGDRRFNLLMRECGQADYEFDAGWAAWILHKTARPDSIEILENSACNGETLKLNISKNANQSKCNLEVVVRDRKDYKNVFEKKIQNISDGVINVKLPYLPAGNYQAEIRVLDEKGDSLDWDACIFDRSTNNSISDISVDKQTVSAGEKMRCNLKVSGETESHKILVKWFDNWGRLIFENDPVAFTEQFDVIAPEGSMSVINNLEVSLISDSGIEARANVQVLMPANVRPNDDFSVLYWGAGAPSDRRTMLYWDELRRKGCFDALANCPSSESAANSAALSHIRTVPYTTAFNNTTLDDKLLNEKWLKNTEDEARAAAKNQSPYNPMGYTLGDEIYVSAFKEEGRFWKSDAGWKLFQEYLRGIYPDIDSLNEQWGSNYARWEDIRFSNEVEVLKILDNPSSWVDTRMFVSTQFSSALQRMRKAIQVEDPNASVGFDGTEQYSSYDGIDWYQLVKGMDVINLYGRDIYSSHYPNKYFNGEAVNSFRPEAKLRGGWLNSSDRYFGGEYATWYLFLKGWNSIWWWYATFLQPEHGAMNWELELQPILAKAIKAAKEIKEGPGTLLAHSQKVWDPIAVHYSENNWHASTIESGCGNHVNYIPDFWNMSDIPNKKYPWDDNLKKMWAGIKPNGHYVESSQNFYLLLHDMGYQPRTMARQEIESGLLIKNKIKVLILPFTVSLTDKEVEAIKDFVKNGGTLIADYRCGIRDGHGRLRKNFPLDEVFGIERKSVELKRYPQEVAWESRNYIKAKFKTSFRDPIIAKSASPKGYFTDGSPALTVNNYYKGTAIYLNSDLYSYFDLRLKGFDRDIRESLRALLMKFGSPKTPQNVAREKSGAFMGATECVRWKNGNNLYVGIIPDYRVYDRRSKDMTIEFPQKMHIYDIKKKEYMGDSGLISDILDPGVAKFYAALPYRVLGLDVSGPQNVKRGQRVKVKIKVNGSSEKTEGHSVRVKVYYPDGTLPEYHQKTIYLPNGEGEYSFIPALNSPEGAWKLQVKECVSGKTKEITFQVN